MFSQLIHQLYTYIFELLFQTSLHFLLNIWLADKEFKIIILLIYYYFVT